MKIVKVILLSLLALVLIMAAVILLVFQIVDPSTYLPEITQKASISLGRPVTVGNLRLGGSLRGISLDAGKIIVADDPAFTKQPFLSVENFRIFPDLRELILFHKFSITGIVLESPRIHIIRSQEGLLNFRPVRSDSRQVSVHQPSVLTAIRNNDVNLSPKPSEPMHKTEPSAFPVIIHDGAISWIDQNLDLPLDLWVKNINIRLSGFSLIKPGTFAGDARFYGQKPNVHIQGSVSFKGKEGGLSLSDTSLYADLSRLDPDELKGISPDFSGQNLFKNIKGSLRLNFRRFDFTGSQAVTADGDILISDGMIKDFNIMKIILSQSLAGFSGFGGNIEDVFNKLLKGTLNAQDTVIQKATGQFTIHDRILTIKDFLLQTDLLELKAQGSLDQGLSADLQTQIHLNSNVSDVLVSQLDGLKFLYDDSQRIAIGGQLTGVYPHWKYRPNKDFKKKSRKFLMKEGGNILGALLGGRL